jgi:acetyl-CoA carboxylase biotin carboxyl carrier protein
VNLSPQDVEDILKLIDSTDYDELHLETDRFALKLRRTSGGWTEEHHTLGEAHLVSGRTADPRKLAGEPGETKEAAEPDRKAQGDPAAAYEDASRAGLHAVRAPLPGIFYRAPKPGAPPFVEVGDHVEPDTVVAILETMKLMNPVRAGASGAVADFAAANNEPAVQGAVLLWVAPDGAPPARS